MPGLHEIPALVRTADDVVVAGAGVGREPPPTGSEPARGGGRLPATHRGLRLHPGAGGRAGGPEPVCGGEPAPAVPAASGGAAAGRRGLVSAGHAKALLGHPDRSYQEALAKRAVQEGLGVREVESLVRERLELEAEIGDPGELVGPAPSGADGSAEDRRQRSGRRACSSWRSCWPDIWTRGCRSPCRRGGARSPSTSPTSRTSSGSTGSSSPTDPGPGTRRVRRPLRLSTGWGQVCGKANGEVQDQENRQVDSRELPPVSSDRDQANLRTQQGS